MIVDEVKTESGWRYVLQCDVGSSQVCRRRWNVRRLQSFKAKPHVCKACHNQRIAKSGGERGGPKAGAIAKKSGQIIRIQPLGSAAAKENPMYLQILKSNGERSGRQAVLTGQLEKARSLNYTAESHVKKWATRKRNGTCKVSRPERRFLNILWALYGDVQESIYEEGFWIDAFIPYLKVYVQFDGVYYQGLDRPYENLNATQRRKYDIDRQADAHFRAAGKILLRLTDVAFASMTENDVKRFCEGQT